MITANRRKVYVGENIDTGYEEEALKISLTLVGMRQSFAIMK